MKKIIITISLIISLLFQIEYSFADETKNNSDSVKVRVTEEIPGVLCTPVKYESGEKKGQIVPNLYDCQVEKGVSQIVKMLGNIIKYFTNIAALAGVLFIVYGGIIYSMAGANDSGKEEGKKIIMGAIFGLVLLLLSGPILQMIAPWIYK
ncbi:MAG: pilin [Candidatus Gracilibacteria bacterium]|nr:pilin [Candidatus Gracilibacteria bacterium]